MSDKRSRATSRGAVVNHTQPRGRAIAAGLIALMAGSARGEEPREHAVKTPAVPQAIYKGVVGTLLDAVPMDSEKRVEAQRTSAVVSSTLSGRSLALMLGVANPLFMVVGLAWGLFAASNIVAAPAQSTPPASPNLGEREALQNTVLASPDAMTMTRTGNLLLCSDTGTDLHQAAASLDVPLASVK